MFEEGQKFDPMPTPRPEPLTLGRAMVNARIVSSPGEASLVLAILAAALIGFAFYLIASSVQPPPTLGPDELRPGEEVPSYVHR